MTPLQLLQMATKLLELYPPDKNLTAEDLQIFGKDKNALADLTWTPWRGGKCPCLDWPLVQVTGKTGWTITDAPYMLNWEHKNEYLDITAYRKA